MSKPEWFESEEFWTYYAPIMFDDARWAEAPDVARLVKEIADIISWNVWQMDGLKGVIPNSCHDVENFNLYGEVDLTPCPGCKTNNIHRHNGIPALLKEFSSGNIYPYHLLYKKK